MTMELDTMAVQSRFTNSQHHTENKERNTLNTHDKSAMVGKTTLVMGLQEELAFVVVKQDTLRNSVHFIANNR